MQTAANGQAHVPGELVPLAGAKDDVEGVRPGGSLELRPENVGPYVSGFEGARSGLGRRVHEGSCYR